MKTNTFLLTIFLLCVLTAETSGKTFNNSMLWKIEGKGLSKPSYIMGLLYLRPASTLSSIPHYQQVFDKVDQIIIEYSTAKVVDENQDIKQLNTLPDSISYHQLYSLQEYAYVDSVLQVHRFPKLCDIKINPAMLMYYYQISMYLKTVKFDEEEDMNTFIQHQADSSKKQIKVLGTTDDELSYLFGINQPLQEQANALYCMLSVPLNTWKENFNKAITAYNHADLLKLETFLRGTNIPCPLLHDQQLERLRVENNKWIQSLPSMMSSKSSLIAVGVTHLVGKEGLLSQLSQQGYRIEAVD